MSTVLRVRGKSQIQFVSRRQAGPLAEDLGAEVALIQALIPLGLEAVHDVLRREVEELAGARYARSGGRPGHVRWSKERGSVYLGDQKLPIVYQRVRDQRRAVEVPLETYQRFQQPRALDRGLLRRVLLGLSCRRYAECADAVPEAFGLAPSTVSRRYIRASARQLQALRERRLDGFDIVAVLLDGKTFAEDEIVIALGVTVQGQKVILGFVSLEDDRRTRRPKRVRQPQTPPGVVRLIRAVRERYPRWGKAKLVVLLRREGCAVSASTVGRTLSRLRALGHLEEPAVVRSRRRRARRARPYARRLRWGYRPERPGDLVEIDTTTVTVGPKLRRIHFTARDVVSRKDVLAVAASPTSAAATRMLREAFGRFGFPVRAIQIDGGSEFKPVEFDLSHTFWTVVTNNPSRSVGLKRSVPTGMFTRHVVLHGRSLDYDTPENAAKAILPLHYLRFMVEMYLCSSRAETPWVLIWPPGQPDSSIRQTRRPIRAARSAAAVPPNPAPQTRMLQEIVTTCP